MNIRTIFIIAMGFTFGGMLIFGILSGSENMIGRTMLYMGIGAAVIGMFDPRAGMFTLVFLSGYSDLVKRLMIFDNYVSQLDIAFSLSPPPLCLAGILLAIALKKLLANDWDLIDLLLLGVGGLGFLYGFSLAASGGLGIGDLRILADYGEFGFIPFALRHTFRNAQDFAKLLKFALWIFIPVALYAVWQRYVGIADFEREYLESGLSIESRHFSDSSGKFRPFSTLNAASSLTMVCATFAILSIVLTITKKIPVAVGLFAFLCMTAGCFVTFTRTGWVSLVLGLTLACVFQVRAAIVLCYVAGVVAFLLLITNAQYIYDNLHDWQFLIYRWADVSSLTQDGDTNQGLRITTLADRLIGFINLSEWRNWKPFGLTEAEKGNLISLGNGGRYSHDMISELIFKFGWMPLLLAGLGVGFVVFQIHKLMFALPKKAYRMAAMCLGTLFGLLASALIGSYILQYPANIMFWLIVGLFFFVLEKGWDDEEWAAWQEYQLAKKTRSVEKKLGKKSGIQVGPLADAQLAGPPE